MPMEFLKKGRKKSFPEGTDLIEFNRELRKHSFKDIENFRIRAFNKDINVDLSNQRILINNKEKNLDLKELLSDIKWISFKRHKISYRMVGGKSRETFIGAGFQGKDKKGNNIQRIVLVDNQGNIKLHKKK